MDTTQVINSKAEIAAAQATGLEPFSVNLSEVRRTTSLMLSQIGRIGIFQQYTRHDISHIDELLELANWVIDDETKAIMTSGDWLMIVLSIYFHDMGMLVTNDEFANRGQSLFPKFKEDLLNIQESGADYVAKLNSLPPDELDKFIYQEFVRKTHALRVRRWIEGHEDAELGYTSTQVKEVQRVLAGLDSAFKKDLALIAESHHLDDLDDLKKYNPTKAYGSKPEEVVNLQYAAIVLRAVDLLHMRRDRTPSILFRLINPTDPISQGEWAKQSSIKKVYPQLGKNKEGLPDETAPKDTIEVHAHFDNENGFFGLTAFLKYVQTELAKCVKWNTECRRQTATKHRFIWKNIVDDAVETEGFLRNQFSFTLDKDKILELLVGHTLYNDTSVVLRELIQNSIDAIRLQKLQDSKSPEGHIRVIWSSSERSLSIIDNGTGMSQSVIEDHLLKVGSSRYQDPQFKKENPNFSPISRFGIGVLSAFMVSDIVEITTCSRADADARRISLRGAHGRYLIRLLDKATNPEVEELGPHGTKFVLKIRPSANLRDVLALVKQWVLFPACKLTVKIDDAEPVKVGFAGPKEALDDYVVSANLQSQTAQGTPTIKVVEKQVGGLTVAYAVRWSDHYKDWTMMSSDQRSSGAYTIPGTCVEGITVDAASPGLRSRNILSVANATGKGAPKTNVARSSLERTSEFETTTAELYDIYLKHVVDEISRLRSGQNYSLTWAVDNAISLAWPLMSQKAAALLPDVLDVKIRDLPIFLVEENGKRRNASFNEVKNEGSFWTCDSALIRSTEHLVKETSGNASVGAVLKVLDDANAILPAGLYLSNFANSTVSGIVEDECEPTDFLLQSAIRRIDVKWKLVGANPRWIRMQDFYSEIEKKPSNRNQLLQQAIDGALGERRRAGYTYNIRRLWLPITDVRANGAEGYAGLGVAGRVFLCPNTPLSEFLVEKAKKVKTEDSEREFFVLAAAALTAIMAESSHEADARLGVTLKKMAYDLGLDFPTLLSQLQPVIDKTPKQFFDSYAWSRREAGL